MPSIPYCPTSYSARYTFSGKERDEETGYSYFGARYYNSSYSIWLSVDPMSDKYPSISPYAYCANNPVKLVDPNGEHEYEFDEYGNYLRTIENKQADIIHLADRYGKRIASSQEFPFGSISQPNNDIPSNSSTLPDATMFQVADERTARDIFEFFAINTYIEWANVRAETQDNGCEYTIGTNHIESSNNISGIITNQGAIVERAVHNHPSNINSVSEGDHKTAVILEQMNPNVQLFNYTIQYGYTQYNQHTGYVDKDGVSHAPSLPEIIVRPK